MTLKEKFLEIWKIAPEDIPEKERIFKKGKIFNIIISFSISIFLGYLMLYIFNDWVSNFETENDGRFKFPFWASSFFIYFFAMVFPIIIANIFYQKSRVASYGFASFIGFILIGVIYYSFIEQKLALYSVLGTSLAMLGNLPSQKDYKIKSFHLIYYFILGIIGCYICIIYTIDDWDVWNWLQFIQLHLFLVIIASVKIRQWGYMYIIGWAFMGFLVMIIPHFPIFGLVEPFSIGSQQIASLSYAGGYFLFVPPILVVVVLWYFFNIQRKANIGMNK